MALQNLRKELSQHVWIEQSILDEQEWSDYNVVLTAAMHSNIFLTAIRTRVEARKGDRESRS
jgi:hypothetical protein